MSIRIVAKWYMVEDERGDRYLVPADRVPAAAVAEWLQEQARERLEVMRLEGVR